MPEQYKTSKPILSKAKTMEATLKYEREQKRLYYERKREIKNYEKFGITNNMDEKSKRYSK